MSAFEEWWNSNDHASVIDGINLFEVAKEAWRAGWSTGWDRASVNAVDIIMKPILNARHTYDLGKSITYIELRKDDSIQ